MENINTNSISVCNALNGLILDKNSQSFPQDIAATFANPFDDVSQICLQDEELTRVLPLGEKHTQESRWGLTQTTQVGDFKQEEEKKEEVRQQEPSRKFAFKRKSSSQIIQEDLKKLKSTLHIPDPQEATITINLRKKYTDDTKAKVAELVKQIGASKVSRYTGLPETSVRRWGKSGGKKKVQQGRKPQWLDLEEELAKYFLKLRSQGLQVTNRILFREARRIAAAKKWESFVGSACWLDGFKSRNKIVYRRTTRVSQKVKEESIQEAKSFQTEFIKLVNEHQYNPSAIVNVDETGIFFDTLSNFTLEHQGKKEVLVTSTGSEKQRITALVGINSSNQVLPLYVIFKAVKVPQDVQELEDDNLKFGANKTAWMTVSTFEQWVDLIWTPYSKRYPRTLLIFDKFKAHTAAPILEKLKQLNTDVLVIPPGLTYFLQPVDVYMNGPLKAGMRQHWQDYMINSKEDPETGRIPKPNRPTLLKWMRSALDELEFEDNIFISTILRDTSKIHSKEVIEENEEINVENDAQELICPEEEYDFEEL